MAPWIPIPLLLGTVFWLIRAEVRGDKRTAYVVKPGSTLLVILVAALSLTSPGVEARYTVWVLVGLLLSLVGDVALMFSSPRAFLVGLVGFLLAHVAYIVVLTSYSGFKLADLATGALLAAVAALVYRMLLPGLGRMKWPVLVYILVICLMVNRALSTLFGGGLSLTQAWLVSVGAIAFWISDLMLGINRFGEPFAWNRVSLAFYYGGQLLIALSASYFG